LTYVKNPAIIKIKQDADRCLIGDSAPMREIKACIKQVAATDSHVLITGETGIGKELVAELIRHTSPRRHEPTGPGPSTTACGPPPSGIDVAH
jgi:two-component system, NtrC family, response regulator PilR